MIPVQRGSDDMPSPDNLLPETDDGMDRITLGEVVRTMNRGFSDLVKKVDDLSEQMTAQRDYYVRREEWKTRNETVDKALGELRDAAKSGKSNFIAIAAIVVAGVVGIIQLMQH